MCHETTAFIIYSKNPISQPCVHSYHPAKKNNVCSISHFHYPLLTEEFAVAELMASRSRPTPSTIDRASATDYASAPFPHPGPGISATRVPDTGLQPQPCPTAQRRNPQSAPVAVNPRNSWLTPLLESWENGPPSLSPIQRRKGSSILSILLSRNDVLPRLTVGSASRTCHLVKSATRISGAKPHIDRVFTDLLAATAFVAVDSVTNSVETGVSFLDVLSLYHKFLRKEKLPAGSWLLSVLDLPCANTGMLDVQWEDAPLASPALAHKDHPGTSLTFPGSITYPHYDGLACGLHAVHWEGQKLWLLWPATPANLSKLAPSKLGVPDEITVCDLIASLEGLETLWLDSRDTSEVSLTLFPGTIHACLGFTESCHTGFFFRCAEWSDRLKELVMWEANWIAKEMDTITCSDDMKKRAAEDFVHGIELWLKMVRSAKISKGSELGGRIIGCLKEAWALAEGNVTRYTTKVPKFR